MANWFWLAVVAALLYGMHQVFTRLAADRIGDGVGGFIVEASAAVSILGYLAYLKTHAALDAAHHERRNHLVRSRGRVCRGGDHRVLPVISAWWSVVGSSDGSCRRRGDHGRCRVHRVSRTG
jgi:hypothetical protein